MPAILALDQGTTSSRSILFDEQGLPLHLSQQEFPQQFPQPGHVEHDPEEIWSSQLNTAKKVLGQIAPSEVAAIGITNQRETIVLWDRQTGKPLANAMVWQSRLTAPRCEQLIADGHQNLIRQKTGLVIDAYFSATKIEHLLKTLSGARERAARGEVLCGTIDTFLIWRLTGGRVHATDVSNASRTMLFNIHTLDWDEELLKLFNIPRQMLPEIRSNSEIYGETSPELFGRPIPISGCIGDQQGATFGQACFEPGNAKNTYGTGCFMLMNTGSKPHSSENGLLTTVGWKVGNEVTYCLEGSVFIAGAAVQWLRDGLKLIETSEEIEPLANSVPDAGGIYFVPAFVGLGTPYWDPNVRGTLVGLTRGTTAAHFARAAVDAMAYQTMDVLRIMQSDAGIPLTTLKVDGGASVNDSLLQFQADLLNVRVQRPRVAETTALGAAYLAGLAVGLWDSQTAIAAHWALDREFEPEMSASRREELARGWGRAVQAARSFAE
ncbi:glycerol kinase GlpK [Planctomicrobium sp. SH664]|uniref:glycerol kinase GlpK n=1 Tax=Planctomicrobium sp. SH664 TaxID=3448125 RepID=UPI003F5B0A2A